MNNLTFPDSFGKKSQQYIELKWHPIINSYPTIHDVYLVTMHIDGIEDYVTVADWDGEKWSNETVGGIIAWMKFPKIYIK